MNTTWFRRCVLLTAAVAACSGAAPVAWGQSIWLPRDRGLALSLETLKPSVEFTNETFMTMAAFVSARVLLKNAPVAIMGEIPYANFDEEISFPGDESGSMLGNVYLGIETAGSSPFFGEFGVRVPTASNGRFPASLIGIVSDVGRWEAFANEYTMVQGAANLRVVDDSGIAARLRLSPTVWFPSDNGDTELFLIYSWQIGYEGTSARVGGAITGRLLLTEDFSNLGERTDNQIELHGDFGPWPIRPGVDFHLPLGETAEAIPFVAGIRLTYVH